VAVERGGNYACARQTHNPDTGTHDQEACSKQERANQTLSEKLDQTNGVNRALRPPVRGLLQVTIPVVTRPPMAGRCVSAETGLQQKIPLGALIFGLRGRTASLPRGLLRARRRARSGKQKHYGHGEPKRCSAIEFLEWAHGASRQRSE
jgi:hypothetical protein